MCSSQLIRMREKFEKKRKFTLWGDNGVVYTVFDSELVYCNV